MTALSRQSACPGLGRSPGEVAFDRCVSGLGFILLLQFALALLALGADPKLRFLFPSPAWVMGGVWVTASSLALLWLWLLGGVLGSWRDPPAKVLRFSALGVLLFYAVFVGSFILLSHALFLSQGES